MVDQKYIYMSIQNQTHPDDAKFRKVAVGTSIKSATHIHRVCWGPA